MGVETILRASRLTATPDFNTFPSVSAGARAQAIDFG
jgi:hypothetical protein